MDATRGCYVVRRDDGTIYAVGKWVVEWPFEVFIPPTKDLTICQNIAIALHGELVPLNEVLSEQSSQETAVS